MGVIYILSNPAFKEFVKIGYADDLEKRLKQLNRSASVPFSFRAYAVYETDKRLTDKEVHKIIDTLNPNLRTIDNFDGKKRTKEFFAMSKEDAYSLLESIAKISGTTDRLKKVKPEGHEIADEELAEEIKNEQRLSAFKFSLCDIKAGEKIHFVNDENIIAIVVDDKKVEYDGETHSLSTLARKLLGVSYPVAGPCFFTYNGKLLKDLRHELND